MVRAYPNMNIMITGRSRTIMSVCQSRVIWRNSLPEMAAILLNTIPESPVILLVKTGSQNPEFRSQ